MRYRLTFVNENKLTQVWSIKMRRTRIIILVSILILAVTSLGAILISFTPLRTLLPGYLKNTERREYLAANERIDSLLHIVAVNDLYLNNLNAIIAGEISPDSILSTPISDPQPLDTALLIGKSPVETEFARNYTAHEGFNLDSISHILPDAPAFVAPVRDGALVRPGQSSLSPRVTFHDNRNSIYAIARATVIEAFSDPHGNGSTIILQHPDGYLTRYSGLSSLYLKPGQTVSSGQRIGQYLKSDGKKFTFRLYRDGIELDPTLYIRF